MAAILFILAFGLLSVSTLQAASTRQGSMRTETDLRADIFMGYDKFVRPVKKASSAVPLSVSMTPLALKTLDVDTQEIKIDSWIMMRWTDEYLQWNPKEYDNITELRVPPTNIWKPDLALYTATPDQSLFPTVQTQSIVFHNGMVLWVPPFTINSRCPLPLRSNSKDAIMCNIRFGSWTYSAKQLDIQLAAEKVDLTNFVDFNPVWKLVRVVSDRESKHYDCCEDDYPVLNFNFTFKRRGFDMNNPTFTMTKLLRK